MVKFLWVLFIASAVMAEDKPLPTLTIQGALPSAWSELTSFKVGGSTEHPVLVFGIRAGIEPTVPLDSVPSTSEFELQTSAPKNLENSSECFTTLLADPTLSRIDLARKNPRDGELPPGDVTLVFKVGDRFKYTTLAQYLTKTSQRLKQFTSGSTKSSAQSAAKSGNLLVLPPESDSQSTGQSAK